MILLLFSGPRCKTVNQLTPPPYFYVTTLNRYDPSTPCPPLFARSGYSTPPPIPSRVSLPPDSGFSSYEEETARRYSSSTSSSSEFWSSETEQEQAVRFHTMLSFPAGEQPPLQSGQRRVSLEMSYKRKPKLSNALFHPMDIAVNVNAPVEMKAKLVEDTGRRRTSVSKKKGASVRNALATPLDVAVNVNTPRNTNITLEAYQDYTRDLDPDKPRSRRQTLLKSSLAAPLNIAVNVNTPVNVKCPINNASIPRKRNSDVRPLPCDTRNMISSPVRLVSTPESSENGDTLTRPEPPVRTPRPHKEDPLQTRRFSGASNSIFALSGCSESSCSSREGSETDTDNSLSGKITAQIKGAYKSNTLNSVKSSTLGSLKKKSGCRRPSIVTGMLYTAMDVAVQVNTPVEAAKVSF